MKETSVWASRAVPRSAAAVPHRAIALASRGQGFTGGFLVLLVLAAGGYRDRRGYASDGQTRHSPPSYCYEQVGWPWPTSTDEARRGLRTAQFGTGRRS